MVHANVAGHEAAAPGATDVNGWKAVTSAIVLGTIGVLSFIIQPGIVQGFVTELGMSEASAVDLAGVEMLGVALATIALALFGGRVDWRHVVAAGLLAAVIGNAGSALTDGGAFAVSRFVAGLGEGAIISISFTFVGVTRRTERNVALYLVLLLTYGAFTLWQLPAILDAVGFPGLFAAFAVASALAVITIPQVPRSFVEDIMENPEVRQLSRSLLGVALAGVLAYNLAQGIAWAVLFLVGVGAGLGEQQVADSLFLSQVVAIAGALASVFLASKLNRNAAIAFGILVGAASIALLLGKPSLMLFTLGVCGFNFLWNFVLPFILGRICDFDTSGRMMSLAIAMQMTGLGGGPLIAGRLIDGTGYGAVLGLCIALFIASFALLQIPIRQHRTLLAAT
ncbi:putative MFS family arabinose efflux permease [Novosphingobium hassiacum]|uniref:Putative MFS family arabinose efflux permease n=1 Tax=Novosphingobium hassiacum TaxID=173676 RepID=A0A7W5ZU35_9SPHN|nr:MFS transporter [Novosphingobium hassiacum]MBB3859511.1 putative MFS family arabinose efflux permease [Novosphingobium hassiacum]